MVRFVRSYGRKRAAEAAARRVVGVVGVANDIEVRLPLLHQRPNPVIARDEVGALRHDLPDAADASQVVVKDGWVNLQGLGSVARRLANGGQTPSSTPASVGETAGIPHRQTARAPAAGRVS